MKVLISGAWNPAFEALPEYLVTALREAGHRVTCFDHRDYHIPGRIRDRIALLDRIDRTLLNRRLLRMANDIRPDLLLVNQGSSLQAQTIASVRRETGAMTVNWWSDYPAEFEAGLALARSGAYDLFLVSGTDAERRHHLAGACQTSMLPFGCDPTTHRPVSPSDSELQRSRCRIAFVGSAYPERRDLLASLADLDLGIWGPGWDRYRDDPEIGSSIREGTLRPADWVKVYSAADLVLNISYGFGGPPEPYGTMANVRVFEIMACGACQLVDAKDDIVRMFRDGEHLATFSTVEEARRKAIALLENPERRRMLARTGYAEVLGRHTWGRRLESIFSDLAALRENSLPECGVPS